MGEREFIMLLLASATAAVAVYFIVRWRRAVRIMRTCVLIGEAMNCMGITPGDAEAAGSQSEIFAAAQRCAVCASDPRCRDLLSGGRRGDLPEACLNRALFDEIAAHKASVRATDPRILESDPIL